MYLKAPISAWKKRKEKSNEKFFVFLFTLMGWLFLLSGDPSEATLYNNTLFKQTYPGKDAKYYTCILCHTGKIGKKGELNPYGKSLDLVLPEKLTVEKLKAVESLDPDGDGVPSGKEIEAGTLPGDPASVPK